MSKNLKIGDLCITVNTIMSGLNDGVLVEIIDINLLMKSSKGESVPYRIRRLDGSSFVSTSDPKTGELRWCKGNDAWAAGCKLKRIEGAKVSQKVRQLAMADARSGWLAQQASTT